MKQFVELPKLKSGDQVGIVSPSMGLPGLFPWVQNLGLKRMREEFGLVPKEYPTTRQMGSSLEDRARDLMAAFADSDNKAVFSSIGGADQIKLIKHLDPKVFKANPKPFFGFSDNTHVHIFLWNLGVPSYYGGGVMNQFGANVEMYDLTKSFLKKALFDSGEFEVEVSELYNDIGLDWAVESNLKLRRALEQNEGLFWDGSQNASGILWGGCVESIIAQVSTGKFLPTDEDMDGVVLILETAEDIPPHWIIEYLLTGFGERGWLNRFSGILVGRPKAWELGKENQFTREEKLEYSQKQRETVVETVRQYNEHIPIVQNLDFGHTSPQIAMPLGRTARIDTQQKKVFLEY